MTNAISRVAHASHERLLSGISGQRLGSWKIADNSGLMSLDDQTRFPIFNTEGKLTGEYAEYRLSANGEVIETRHVPVAFRMEYPL